MKKSIWMVIFTIFIIIIYYSLNGLKVENHKEKNDENVVQHPHLGKIPLPTPLVLPPVFQKEPDKENTKNNGNGEYSSNDSNTLNIGEKSEDLIILPDDIKQAVMEDIKNNILASTAAISAGFTEKGSDVISSSIDTISIHDMPKELQESIKKDFEKSRRNGFDDVTEKDADEITGVVNYILGSSQNIPNITFQLSEIPQDIISNYYYLGYTFPSTFVTESPDSNYDTVRRIYQRNDSDHTLIFEETSLKSGSVNLISEFINIKIYTYSGIYSIKKSASGKVYAMLNWVTPNYAYSLYQINSLSNAASILTFLAKKITEINVKNKPKANDNTPTVTDQLPAL